MKRVVIILIGLTCLLACKKEKASTDNKVASFRIEQNDTEIKVFLAGGSAVLATQNAKPDFRPYIHPITAPGSAVSLTQFSPGHHKTTRVVEAIVARGHVERRAVRIPVEHEHRVGDLEARVVPEVVELPEGGPVRPAVGRRHEKHPAAALSQQTQHVASAEGVLLRPEVEPPHPIRVALLRSLGLEGMGAGEREDDQRGRQCETRAGHVRKTGRWVG